MMAGFAGQNHDGALAILEEMLTVIVENELGSLSIRLKVQFFGDVPERHVRLVAKTLLVWAQRGDGGGGESNLRLANVAQGGEAFTANKHVHEIGAHVRCLVVKPEKPMVVAQRQGRTYIQGMLNRALRLLCCG